MAAGGIEQARHLISGAIAARLFACATVHVGSSRQVLWTEAFGSRFFDSASPATPETWFDLASLTKPLATTSITLDLASRGVLSLDEPVARSIPAWRGDDRQPVTIADLMEHASGLPARLPQGEPLPTTRGEFLSAICRVPLEYTPRTRAVYSDLGFILLGLLAEELDGASLDAMFGRITTQVGSLYPEARAIAYRVPAEAIAGAAPTRPLPDDERGLDVLVGRVHDTYAAALDGVAGHAGLFGTAAAVAAMANAALRSLRGIPDLAGAFSVAMARRAVTASTVPGSSRALGWDRMLPTSSCGTRMSAAAVGHVGFTGTSLWIDPERDRYYVLLTNRVYGEGTTDQMRDVRRAFHDALADL